VFRVCACEFMFRSMTRAAKAQLTTNLGRGEMIYVAMKEIEKSSIFGRDQRAQLKLSIGEPKNLHDAH
jgi:hypothetical protein